MDKYLKELESYIELNSKNKSKEYASVQKFHYTVPSLRAFIKQKVFSFQEHDAELQLAIWDFIWNNTSYFESMSLSIYPFQHKSLSKNEFEKIINWVDKCSCWEHSDDLSKIYAQVLEENPTWILPYFKKWNKSENLWKRRQSIVGLLEYASKRKKVLPFEELISFIQPLLKDDAYYVQKGIGWTLREIYNIYPKETLDFIEKNTLDISSIAYSAATEKINKETKQKLNVLRKESRKK
jgi:3-methyladenine DNA glycosylase AlkD